LDRRPKIVKDPQKAVKSETVCYEKTVDTRRNMGIIFLNAFEAAFLNIPVNVEKG